LGTSGSSNRNQVAPGTSPNNSLPGINLNAQGAAGGVDVNVDPSRRGTNVGVDANGRRIGVDAGGRQNQRGARNDPNDWRFSFYNGEWWYWMPNNSWMFYRDNKWSPYTADEFRPFTRYSAGYRGTGDGANVQIYTDENGRRYRRDYTPDRRLLRNPEGAGERIGNAIGNAIRGAASGDTGARTDVEIGDGRRE
jgi:hypothetical protein